MNEFHMEQIHNVESNWLLNTRGSYCTSLILQLHDIHVSQFNVSFTQQLHIFDKFSSVFTNLLYQSASCLSTSLRKRSREYNKIETTSHK